MDSKLLSFAAFSVCFCIVVSRPQEITPAVVLKEGCREGQLFSCITNVFSFFLSADGQRLSQLRDSPIKKPLEERDYNTICRLGQTTIGCFDKWVEKCVPSEISGVHIVSKGTVKLLSSCNKTDSYTKFNKLAICSENMTAIHKTCGEQMKAIHGDINYRNPKVFLARDNLQRDVCCNLKKYNDCFMPKVQTACGQEGKDLTNEFIQRVFDSYQCTETIFGACNVVQPTV